jgi:hypothetical protein
MLAAASERAGLTDEEAMEMALRETAAARAQAVTGRSA